MWLLAWAWDEESQFIPKSFVWRIFYNSRNRLCLGTTAFVLPYASVWKDVSLWQAGIQIWGSRYPKENVEKDFSFPDSC